MIYYEIKILLKEINLFRTEIKLYRKRNFKVRLRTTELKRLKND